MATASTTMPTPDHTYSTTVTYSKPAPVRIYSTIATTSVPPKPVPNSDAMRDLLRYALDMDAGPVSCPQHATVQTTISVKSPISSSVVTPSPTFDVHLDVADLEFLQKKLGECKGKLGSALTNAMGENPCVKVVSVLEQSLREGTGVALTEPLRKQLHTDREKRFTVGSRKVIVPKSVACCHLHQVQGVQRSRLRFPRCRRQLQLIWL